ncbi:MAG: hypothetical protein ABIW76_15905, partial [Fibrobacteria bacterium]
MMQGRTKIFGRLMLAGGIGFAGAQAGAVDLSGTVKDSKTGTPIVGAAVTLVSDSTLTDNTDATGAFHLARAATGLLSNDGNADKTGQDISLAGTVLSMDVPHANTGITVDVFDLKSARVGTLVDRRAGLGRYRIDLAAAALPGGLYLVRARAGR